MWRSKRRQFQLMTQADKLPRAWSAAVITLGAQLRAARSWGQTQTSCLAKCVDRIWNLIKPRDTWLVSQQRWRTTVKPFMVVQSPQQSSLGAAVRQYAIEPQRQFCNSVTKRRVNIIFWDTCRQNWGVTRPFSDCAQDLTNSSWVDYSHVGPSLVAFWHWKHNQTVVEGPVDAPWCWEMYLGRRSKSEARRPF